MLHVQSVVLKMLPGFLIMFWKIGRGPTTFSSVLSPSLYLRPCYGRKGKGRKYMEVADSDVLMLVGWQHSLLLVYVCFHSISEQSCLWKRTFWLSCGCADLLHNKMAVSVRSVVKVCTVVNNRNTNK